MSETLSALAGLLLKSAAVAFIANEVRGIILAVPVLYAMYLSGGTAMAVLLGICSLSGIVLSVVVPLFLARKYNLLKPASARTRSAIRS